MQTPDVSKPKKIATTFGGLLKKSIKKLKAEVSHVLIRYRNTLSPVAVAYAHEIFPARR